MKLSPLVIIMIGKRFSNNIKVMSLNCRKYRAAGEGKFAFEGSVHSICHVSFK